MGWIYLLIAGVLECLWAIGLKYSDGFTRFWPSVITAVLIVVSLATPPPPEEGVMQKEVEPPSAASVSWRKVDGWATLVLLGLVGLIWVVFSG